MKNKKAIIILIVLILFTLIGSVSANDANTTQEISASDTEDVTGAVNVDSTNDYTNDLTYESADLNDSEILTESDNDLKENVIGNSNNDFNKELLFSSNSEILGASNDNDVLCSSATYSYIDGKLLYTTSGDIGGVNEELMMEQSDINDEVASDFTDDISDVACESNNDDEILTSGNNDKEISDVESGKVLSSSNSNTLKMNNDNNKEILSSSNSEIIGMSNDNDLLQSISVSTATKTSISGTISSTFTMDYSSTLYIIVTVQGTAYEWQTVEDGRKGKNTISKDFSISGNFPPGTYTVGYSITANRLYDSGSTTCTVSKSTPTVTVSSKSITYNGGTYSVSGTCSVNGLTITLKAGSTTLGSTTSSSGSWTVSSISSTLVNVGSYTLTATSTETTSYASASGTNTLTVSKNSPTVYVYSKSVDYNTGTYSITGSCSINGLSITLKVGSTSIGSATVSSGSWSYSGISSTKFNPGSYTIYASYGGSTNYYSDSDTATLTVSKSTPTIVISNSPNIVYGDGVYSVSGTAKIIKSSNSYNVGEGTVTLKCGDTVLGTSSVSGGEWMVSNIDSKLVDPKSTSYTITAYYESNTYYNEASGTNSLTVSKFTPNIIINPVTIFYNQTDNGVLSGRVYMYDGSFYESSIDLYVDDVLVGSNIAVSGDGYWNYTLSSTNDFKPSATAYTVKVEYNGNSYTESQTLSENKYMVNKGITYPTIQSTGTIDKGRTEYIYVYVTNIMGNGYLRGIDVTLKGTGIDGTLTNTSDSNGMATFSFSDLEKGKYDDWKVSIMGNDYYSGRDNVAVSTFYVQSPLSVFIINVTPSNSTFPDELIVNGYVDADVNLQGNVTLIMGDKTYIGLLDSNGNFTTSLIGVKPGNYTNITTRYNPTVDEFYYRGVEGTVSIQETIVNKYLPAVIFDSVNVDFNSYPGNATIVGHITYVNNQIPTGRIEILYNGKVYGNSTVDDTGSFTIAAADLPRGEYNLTINYLGDDYYLNNTNTTSDISINPSSVNFTITVNNATYNVDKTSTTIEVVLAGLYGGNDIPKGTVRLKVGDKYWDATIDETGKATIEINSLNAGDYSGAELKYIKSDDEQSYKDSDTVVDFSIYKADPGLSVRAPTIGAGKDGSIYITLNDNTSGVVILTVGSTVKVTLNITGGTNRTYVITRPPVGANQVIANYTGDVNFNNSIAETMLYIERPDSYLNYTVYDITYGESENIEFTVYMDEAMTQIAENATGTIYVYNLDKDYELEVVNGKAYLEVDNLIKGTYRVIAFYSGNDALGGSRKNMPFNVDGAITPLTITVNNDSVIAGEDIIVTVSLNNTINDVIQLFVDNKLYYSNTTVNGVTQFVLRNLTYGSHNITAVFNGNGGFENADNNTTVAVNRIEVNPSIIIDHNCDIVFNITVPTQTTGYIRITGNGTDETILITDNLATLTLPNVTRGDYRFNIVYDGNWKYLPFDIEKTFTVTNVDDYVLNITSTEAVFNKTVNITVTAFSDLEGKTINLTVDGSTKAVATVINGVAEFNNVYLVSNTNGEFEVVASYDGDSIYEAKRFTIHVPVIPTGDYTLGLKALSIVNVGDNVCINISAPELITAVNLTVNGKTYIVNRNNFTYHIDDIDEGTYNIAVSYAGDKAYVAKNNSTVFNVIKKDSVVLVDVDDTVYGENAIINISVTDGVTGYVLVTIDNKTGKYDLNGNTTQIISKEYSQGLHNVSVVYVGDRKYNPSGNLTNFTVSRAFDYNMGVYENETLIDNNTVLHKFVDHTLVVDVVLPEDATGNLTFNLYENNVKISTWTTLLPKNLINYELRDVTNYTMEILYSGDNNYKNNVFRFDVNVHKFLIDAEATFTDNPYYVLSDSVINITSNLNNRQIRVYIDGNYYTLTSSIVDNCTVVNLGKLSAGNHTISLMYNGDTYYTSLFATHNITVLKLDSSVNVTATNVRTGNSVIIDVNASGSGSANIVILNGTTVLGSYNITVNNGRGSYIVPIDFAEGNYNVNITYYGDEIYYGNTNRTTFTVTDRIVSDLDIVKPVFVVNTPSVINVTSNFPSGIVEVYVDGIKQDNITITDNNGSISLDGLSAGNHKILLSFAGDYDYSEITKSFDIFVIKNNSTVNVTATSVRTGNPVIIDVNASGSGSANIVILDGNSVLGSYNITINNGVGSFIVPIDFAEGNYNVNITYYGDEIYYGNTNKTSFTVTDRIISEISFTEPASYIVNKTSTIRVTANFPTGTLNVFVDGIKINGILVDNYNADLVLDYLSAGNHNILVTYDGDYDYTNATNNLTVNVVKYDSLLTVDINTPLYVDDLVDITIHVNETAGGYVSVNVNNKDYHIKIKDSIAKLNLTGLAYDTYAVGVNYLGDDYYNPINTTKEFTISRYSSNINIADITMGDDLQINITSIDGFNPDEVTGKLNITIGTITLTDLSVVDGKIIIPVNKLPELPDNYRVIANYSGNYKFLPSDITTNININKLPAPTINQVLNVTIDDDLNITLTGDSRYNIDGNVTVKINDGEEFILPVKDGVVTVPSGKLPQAESSNNIKIIYVNGTYYQGTDAEWILHSDKITDYTFTISNDTVRFGENATLEINLPADVTGTLIIKVNGVDNTVAVNGGYGKLENIDGLHAGVNTVESTFGNGKYETSTATSTIQVNPNDITLEIIVPSEQLYVDESAEITVRANVSMNNEVTVFVNGKAQSLKLNDGEGSFTINPLVYGEYVFTAVFDGNENYTYATASVKSFNVDKNNVTLNVTTANVIVGHDVNIKVNINDDATGLVIVRINNNQYSLNVTDKEYTLSVPDLGNGTYSIVAKYYGDDKYYGFENTTSVEVLKLTPTISANSSILVGEDLTIVVENSTSLVGKAVGKLNLTIDGFGTVEADVVNGIAVIKASELPQVNKTYTASVEYYGDNNYYGKVESISFVVGKVSDVVITVQGNVTIDDELIIAVGDSTTDGKLNVTIGTGDVFTVNVINGTAVIPVDKLPQVSDNYNIKVSYWNGSYWDDKEVTTSFHADKITVYDFIISEDTVKFEENATLTITLPSDVNTVLTVKINGVDKTVEIINGNGKLENINNLHAGVNTVESTFDSDKYETSTATSTIIVNPNDITLTISVPAEQLYVDQSATIAVKANVTMNNNVTVYVNGVARSLKLNNGEGSFTIDPLAYGKYVFTAIFNGNENYTYATAGEKSFNVDKNNVTLNVTTANVIVGHDVNIKVNINDDATGLVIVKINNNEYSLNITNKEYTLCVPNLGNGTYSILAKYYGDDKYYGFENTTTVEVLKLTPIISANDTILIGDDLVITIENAISLVGKATGKLNLTIDGFGTVESDVINGIAVIKASDLPQENNTYTASVVYYGDNNYYGLTQVVTFTITKVPSLIITVPVNVTIDEELIITVGDSTTDGKLNVTIGNGNEFTVDVINGIATIPVSELPQVSGDYNISVYYYGGSYWSNMGYNTTFHADKITVYPFNISSPTIRFGENATLEINLPSDVTTTLTVTINDVEKTVDITDGYGKLENINNLHAKANSVSATFSSDKYETSTATSTIQVDPNDITLEIIVPTQQLYVDQSATVTVRANVSMNNNVTVYVNGKTQILKLNNGEGSFTIAPLVYGEYVFTAIFDGNENYTYTVASEKSFSVDKNNIALNVTSSDVVVGHDVNIMVNINDDATGLVIVKVDSTEYSLNLDNKQYTLVVSGLGNGTHNIVAKYYGDSKYYGDENTTTVNVLKLVPVITVSSEVLIGEDLTISIANSSSLVANPGGKLKFTIDGYGPVEIEITNGVGIIKGSSLPQVDNTYTATVEYSGDENYYNLTETVSFKINKDPSLIITVPGNVTIDDELIITVGDSTTDGKLNVTIGNGEMFTVDVINGTAVIPVEYLPQESNLYAISLDYYGGSYWNDYSVVRSFHADKITDYAFIITNETIKFDETATLRFTLPSDVNTTLTVFIDDIVKTVKITNGFGVLTVSNLHAGVNIVTSSFGSGKYETSTATSYIRVLANEITLTIIVPEEQLYVDQSATVKVMANVTMNNTVTVYVNGEPRSLDLTNGEANFTINPLVYGKYVFTAVFDGNENYTRANAEMKTFTVDKNTVYFNVTANDIFVDEDAFISITGLPEDAVGSVSVNVNGTIYLVNIAKGKGNITLSGLKYGKYDVVANFTGDDKYHSNVNTTSFSVNKNAIGEIKVTSDEIKDNKTHVTVSVDKLDATGEVIITTVNGEFTGKLLDGKTIIEVTDLNDVENPFNVTYVGDAKYLSNTTNGVIVAGGIYIESYIYVTVDDIMVDGTAQIKVTVPTDATGLVRIELAGKSYVLPVKDGGVEWSVNNLASDKYNVAATYLGDDKYYSSTNTTNFNVLKYDSAISVADGEGIAGELVTVIVQSVGDVLSGNVVVCVDGVNYTGVMDNGVCKVNVTFTKSGALDVVAYYEGNDYYNKSSASGLFNILHADSTVIVSAEDIVVGSDAVIIVNVAGDATGNVSIVLNGDSSYDHVTVTDGVAKFIIPGLNPDTYEVIVTYNGDAKYKANSNTTSFVVNKKDVSPSNNVTSVDVSVDENGTATLNITVGDNTTGNITVTIGDKNYTVPIVNGSAIVVVDNATDKNISISYTGDGNHTGFNQTVVISEDGIKFDSSLKITADDISVGDVAVIYVYTPVDATGKMLITINNNEYSSDISNGVAVFNISGLGNGTHIITANYNGDDKYLKSTNKSSITVNKLESSISVSAGDIDVGDSEVITVVVPGDATGTVTITVDGKDYTSSISGGNAVFYINNLAEGSYNVVARYNGDNKYNANDNSTSFVVSKNVIDPVGDNKTSVDVVENENGTSTITVNVPEDATGNVTITVGDKNYTVPIVNGTASVTVDKVDNNTNISVDYPGDDKYDGFNQTGVISDGGVKLNIPITVTLDKNEYVAGETAVITVSLPGDANGNITIKVNGEVVTVTKDTVVEYVVPASGLFDVEAVYSGDNKYNSAVNSTSFEAVRANSTMTISVDDTAYDKNATVVVTLPSDAKGNVTINVNGKNYTADVVGGKATFTLPKLDRGNYQITATFNGDDKYNAAGSIDNLNIINKEVVVNVSAPGIVWGDVASVTVSVTDGATGYVILNIGNDTYFAYLENSTATISIAGLEPGNHDISVYYSGDNEYQNATVGSVISVARLSSTTVVNVSDITEGEVLNVVVFVPVNATGHVNIVINGKTYTANITEGMAVISVSGLSSGSYTVYALYVGDKYYNESTGSANFAVYANTTVFAYEMTRGYNSGVDYEARFTDSLGNPLNNTDVVISVGGVDYTVRTDSDGVARLNVNLPVGMHTVSIFNPVTGEETHSNVTIAKRLIENKNIVTDYNSGYLYKVRVIGDDGNPVGAGVKFTIPINGKKYNYYTDKNGYLTIKIDKRFKASISKKKLVYTLTLSYKGFTVKNKITIKQVLKTKRIVKLKKGKKLVLKAKLKWSNGKAIKGKVIKFKFKGKTYKAKTNKKGVAKVVIKKKVIKKLKLGKNYKVKVTYLTDTVKSWVKYRK